MNTVFPIVRPIFEWKTLMDLIFGYNVKKIVIVLAFVKLRFKKHLQKMFFPLKKNNDAKSVTY